MVPDKFDMVDMGGIDLIESQGVAVEGLYQRLVESITLCRYQCLYNWKFNGILIPPSYVEMVVRDGSVRINEGVNVDENDVVHIYSIEPEPPAPILPVIESLSVVENGIYQVPTGVDGYNPVSVNVPQQAAVLYTNYQFHPTDPYVVTEAGIVLATLGGRVFKKTNAGKAYGAVLRVGAYSAPYLISNESANYVKYNPPSSYTPQTIIKDGVTWYWMGGEWAMAVTPTESGGVLPLYNIGNSYSTNAEAASAFLDYILSLPDTTTPVYKPDSTGLIQVPEGYDGFGTLYIV